MNRDCRDKLNLPPPPPSPLIKFSLHIVPCSLWMGHSTSCPLSSLESHGKTSGDARRFNEIIPLPPDFTLGAFHSSPWKLTTRLSRFSSVCFPLALSFFFSSGGELAVWHKGVRKVWRQGSGGGAWWRGGESDERARANGRCG